MKDRWIGARDRHAGRSVSDALLVDKRETGVLRETFRAREVPMKGGLGSSLVSNKVVLLVKETLNEGCVIVVVDIAEKKASRPPATNPTRAE